MAIYPLLPSRSPPRKRRPRSFWFSSFKASKKQPGSPLSRGRADENLDLVFELLGQFFDVFRWPVGDVHAQVQAHVRQHFLDLVQGLAAEVGGAKHLGFGLL